MRSDESPIRVTPLVLILCGFGGVGACAWAAWKWGLVGAVFAVGAIWLVVAAVASVAYAISRVAGRDSKSTRPAADASSEKVGERGDPPRLLTKR